MWSIITLGWTLLFLLICKQELLKKLKSQQLSLLLSCFSHNDKAPCFKSVSIKLFSLWFKPDTEINLIQPVPLCESKRGPIDDFSGELVGIKSQVVLSCSLAMTQTNLSWTGKLMLYEIFEDFTPAQHVSQLGWAALQTHPLGCLICFAFLPSVFYSFSKTQLQL